EGTDPTAYFTDMLFRPAPAGGVAATETEEATTGEPVATEPAADADAGTSTTLTAPASRPAASSAPAETPTSTASSPAPGDDAALRAEAGRIFTASAVSGELPEAD